MNRFIKMFIPSSDKTSEIVANQIQSSFNKNAAGHEETIAKVSEIAYAAGNLTIRLSAITKDGKIDDDEKRSLREKEIKHLVKNIYALAGLEK